MTEKKYNDLPEVYIDDILMSLKYFPDEHEAHLKIIDPQVCINCKAKPCIQFCPVGAYRTQDGGTVQIAFQACVECGTCERNCPSEAIIWVDDSELDTGALSQSVDQASTS